ncbi:MAG: phosphate ABC transporter substrate-binding protein [Candidatus Coproplasma sp.]
MKKLTKVIMSGAAVAAIGCSMAFSLTACGDNGNDGLSGEVNITGSTSVQPVMEILADAFENKHSGVDITVQGGGSGVGIKDTQDGKNDFGMSSRDLKSTETGIVAKKICTDGVALIVNKSCTVNDVTKEQLKALYENVTTISSITAAISREDGSGTRGAFDEIIGISTVNSLVSIQNSTGAVITEIVGNSAGNTVGYISLGSVNDTVKTLKYEGVEPTVTNITNGSYKLSRPFNIVYKSEDTLSEAAKAFIDFILSDEGQDIIENQGYVRL